ncbi:FG-GAP-like repeat-containing protein [Streptomyces sp. SP18CS02]|uniref:FG-GAP-like repeat-containing protein n=1 Tax=Streptomyces sp. SP18CS02 TaxID=3002531 RepID=UPI002E797881|nr:FG-GAP-like repeat-containing protein [Streptomyces sp. SP18CS02]MEE1756426.1 FG-GAP-like repeat-containing protein [Streptomyces sp. SP18CS02]
MYRSYGTPDPNGNLNAATWGRAAGRVKISTGTHPQSLYPALGASGDLNGDSTPDLWARKSDNTLLGWPGKTTGTGLTGLGASFTIEGITGGLRLAPGSRISSGQSITSTTAKLTTKPAGNLVITSSAGKELWSSGAPSPAHADATALVHTNGDIGLYDKGGTFIKSATGIDSTTPGITAEGSAQLQDRGSLVVHNAKGHSIWSSGTQIRHDYNRDGRSDIGVWYDHADGSDATWSFLTNTDGTFNRPTRSFQAPSGGWDVTRARFATGDFNGDGYGDAVVLYVKTDNSTRMWTLSGKSDGGFNEPIAGWDAPAGSLNLAASTIQAGDFNGDGRDDIALWYVYPDTHDQVMLTTAISTPHDAFGPPNDKALVVNGSWDLAKSRLVVGDYNGDGLDDLAAMYNNTDNSITMWTWTIKPDGYFNAAKPGWTANSNDWNFAATRFLTSYTS